MGKIREVRELVLYHWKALAGFEIMYKFASGLVFVPLFWGMFDLIMKSTGYSYLSLLYNFEVISMRYVRGQE